MRVVCAVALIIGMALPAVAEDERGWSFSGSFNGSSNSDGVVTKAETTLGYSFNRHFSTYAGVPVYFVNLSSTTTTTDGFMSGVGNAFLGFRYAVRNDALDYSSNLELTAPTGDKSRGFSTGRVTADWTNRFSKTFSSFTPFGSVGIANTVSDTAFFVRPFTSLGVVGHFEGGATYDLLHATRVGASAYAVRGAGQQRIISKVIARGGSSSGSSGRGNGRGTGGGTSAVFDTQTETVTQASAADDHGFSTWLGFSPARAFDLYGGYSRSVNYDFNTIFFGVGFRVGK